ncbi:unnamed protein product, partial [Iphiclides podalirius]
MADMVMGSITGDRSIQLSPAERSAPLGAVAKDSEHRALVAIVQALCGSPSGSASGGAGFARRAAAISCCHVATDATLCGRSRNRGVTDTGVLGFHTGRDGRPSKS